MENKIILTKEGLEELKSELEMRKTTTRLEVANEIELAREQGDLSENAAYKSAMESKDFNEVRIDELEKLIKSAVVKKGSPNDNRIDLGEEFKLVQTDGKREIKYKLVGGNEADPQQGKISLDSPIGKAVYHKRIGDIVEIELPTGKVKFKIEKI